MSTLSKIESEIAALPPNLQAEVLDFVQFVKQRHGLPAAPVAVAAAPDTGDSAFFQALEAAGLVGCIETDEQLSTTYKNRLDFSAKCGTRP
jgi:hypothetical protein